MYIFDWILLNVMEVRYITLEAWAYNVTNRENNILKMFELT